ncbi:MAG: hypothetical protein ACR5LD_10875 [Symbiopectobacterium sp.]
MQIGLELVDLDDVEAVIQAVGTVSSDTVVDNQPVDIYIINKDEKGRRKPLFSAPHATPFYERKWGSLLREFKQMGKNVIYLVHPMFRGCQLDQIARSSSKSISNTKLDSNEL